jgi:hypothetical protein
MRTTILIAVLLTSQIGFSKNFTMIAVGDTGKGNEGQYQVGRAIGAECERTKCAFAVLLGDNYYDIGVSSPTDPQFSEKFEKPYAPVKVPFYVVLGNHDYGQYANDWRRGDHQIEYSKTQPKYKLPAHYYTFEKENVLFIVLDTSRLFHDKDARLQKDFVVQAIRKNTKKWIVVLSHHPYISNGQHGNAGRYDGVPFPPYSGSVIKDLLDKEICPHVDLVVSGHDHNLQTLQGPTVCARPIFVVSGGGASAKDNLRGTNPAIFQKAVLGFTSFRFSDSTIDIEHRNEDGDLEHVYKLEK